MSKGLSINAIYTYSRFMDDKTSPQAPCANDRDFESCANWDLPQRQKSVAAVNC